jgi:hypothetical protein
MYGFYSQLPSISMNNAYYRKDQYTIDGSEALVQGKKVFYAYKGSKAEGLYFEDANGERKYGAFIDNFESFRNLKAGLPEGENLDPGKKYSLWIYNPYKKSVPLKGLRVGIAYLDESKRVIEVLAVRPGLDPLAVLSAGDTLQVGITLPEPVKDDPVYARAVVSENDLPWGINGRAQLIKQ